MPAPRRVAIHRASQIAAARRAESPPADDRQSQDSVLTNEPGLIVKHAHSPTIILFNAQA